VPEVQKAARRAQALSALSGQVGVDLLMDVKLYILADYLDIDSLKKQALLNTEHRLQNHFDAGMFLEPISIAMANTKADDSGLRRVVMSACVRHATLVEKSEQLRRVLQDHEPLAWSLLVTLKTTADASKEESENLLQSAQKELLLQTAKVDILFTNLRRAEKNLVDTVKLLRTTKECRATNCENEFGAALETYANGYVKGVRCKRCKCRHPLISSEPERK
jgi:hypothetical protein